MPPKKKSNTTGENREEVPRSRMKREREDEQGEAIIKTEADVETAAPPPSYNPAAKAAIVAAIKSQKVGMVKLFLDKKSVDPVELAEISDIALSRGDEEVFRLLVEYGVPVSSTVLKTVLTRWMDGSGCEETLCFILQHLLREDRPRGGEEVKTNVVLNETYSVETGSKHPYFVELCPLSYALLSKASESLLESLIAGGASVSLQFNSRSKVASSDLSAPYVVDAENGVEYIVPTVAGSSLRSGLNEMGGMISRSRGDRTDALRANSMDSLLVNPIKSHVDTDAFDEGPIASTLLTTICRKRESYFSSKTPFCRTIVDVLVSRDGIRSIFKTVVYFPPNTTLADYHKVLWDALKSNVEFPEEVSDEEDRFKVFSDNLRLRQLFDQPKDDGDQGKPTRRWEARLLGTHRGTLIDKPHSFEDLCHVRTRISSLSQKMKFKPLRLVVFDKVDQPLEFHSYGETDILQSVLENFPLKRRGNGDTPNGNSPPPGTSQQLSEEEVKAACLFLLRRGARCDVEVGGRTALELTATKYSEDLAELLLTSL